MKFGVCAPLEKMDLLAEVGYDYIELGVQSALIPEKDEAEFQKIQEKALGCSIKAEAYAGFLPSDLRVVGDEIDQKRLSNYVVTACRRAQLLGSEIIVYGSSGSRNVAEGYNFDRALGQIADFLSMAAGHAAGSAGGHISHVVRRLPDELSDIFYNTDHSDWLPLAVCHD